MTSPTEFLRLYKTDRWQTAVDKENCRSCFHKCQKTLEGAPDDYLILRLYYLTSLVISYIGQTVIRTTEVNLLGYVQPTLKEKTLITECYKELGFLALIIRSCASNTSQTRSGIRIMNVWC